MDRIQLCYMTVHKKSNTVSGVKTLINITALGEAKDDELLGIAESSLFFRYFLS